MTPGDRSCNPVPSNQAPPLRVYIGGQQDDDRWPRVLITIARSRTSTYATVVCTVTVQIVTATPDISRPRAPRRPINSFLITSTKTSHLTTTVYRYSFDENKKERKRERKKKEFTRPSSQSLRACFIQKAHLLCPGIFRFFHFFLVSTDFRYLSNYRPSCWMVERSM